MQFAKCNRNIVCIYILVGFLESGLISRPTQPDAVIFLRRLSNKIIRKTRGILFFFLFVRVDLQEIISIRRIAYLQPCRFTCLQFTRFQPIDYERD